MPKIIVTTTNGETITVSASPGYSLMEIMREQDIDEIEAICGGCCSCGTCHVVIDPNWIQRLPAITEGEESMLVTLVSRQPTSRLSCQIDFEEELDGLHVFIVQAS